MADNRLPPLDEDNNLNEDTVPHTSSGQTRPHAPLRVPNDDTEESRRHQTEMLRRADTSQNAPRGNPGQHVEPLPNAPRRQAPQGYPQRPARQQRTSAQDSALYLPWWSIALMLVGVLVVSFGIIGGIFLLGNAGGSLTEPTAIIMIVTAPPDALAQQVNPTTGAQVPATQIIIAPAGDTGNLALDGPTLAPVEISPTPAAIEIGSTVIVTGVEEQMLNVRDAADLTNSNVRFRADEGSIFTVVEGPAQNSGFTWWRIQDPNDVNRNGWAVSNFLRVTAP